MILYAVGYCSETTEYEDGLYLYKEFNPNLKIWRLQKMKSSPEVVYEEIDTEITTDKKYPEGVYEEINQKLNGELTRNDFSSEFDDFSNDYSEEEQLTEPSLNKLEDLIESDAFDIKIYKDYKHFDAVHIVSETFKEHFGIKF
ncbi:hypothetical protein NGRA_0294, partial [Nosema granulosis]